MAGPGPFARRLFRAVLAAQHDYVPEVVEGAPPARRLAVAGSRAAARAGLYRRRFDLDEASERLANLSSALDELERTYALFADDASRTRFVQLFALRVVGGEHLRGPVGYDEFARLERDVAGGRVTGPAGTPIVLRASPSALASVFALGQYRYGDAVCAWPGDVVVDGGAAWGDTALWFADLVGADGRVLAFEFAPGNLAALGENLRANPGLAERIEVREQALWDRTGERLAFSDAGQMTQLGAGDRETTTVAVDGLGLERLDFLKLDVEGAEPRVLAGAAATLRAHRPALAIAAYHDPWHLVRLPQWVHDLGLGYELHLGHAAPGETETVLFARVRRSRT